MNLRVKYVKVSTSFGDVWLTPLRDGMVCFASDSVPAWDAEDGKGERTTLLVNRVEYRVRGWLVRDETGAWQRDGDLMINRAHDWKDVSAPARRKLEGAIYGELARWLQDDKAQPFHGLMARVERSNLEDKRKQITREIEAAHTLIQRLTADLEDVNGMIATHDA